MNHSSDRIAIKVAVIYVIGAGCWILFSDELISLLVPDAHQRTELSIFKGWVFVLLTGYLLYRLLSALLQRWNNDVNAHLAREVEQKEQLKIFSEAYRVVNDAVFLVDIGTERILEANPAAEKMYGYSRAEFLQMKASDISAEPEATRQVITTLQKFVPLRWHRRKNGERFPIEAATNFFEYKGRKVHVAVMREITERLKVENDLKASEERYRSLFEHMNEGVAYCQIIYEGDVPVDYVHLAVNEKAMSVAGLKDVVGRRATELMPDFREKDAEIFQMLARVAATGMPEASESYVVSLQKWLRLSIYSPQRGFFVVVYDDISERKRAEEALKKQSALINSLLDTIPDLIFYKDLNGVYLGCNPAFEKFTGRKREEILGRTDHDLFDQTTADFFRAQDAKMLATMESRENEEWGTYPEGHKVLLHTLKTPYRGIDGNVTGVLGISRDITARHLMERALREREEQLVLFVEHSPAAIAMLDRDMRYIVASRRWQEDFGLSEDSLAGKSHYEVFPEIPEDWKKVHQRCLAGMMEKCEEEEFKRADGTSKWLRWEVRPWRHADTSIGGVIIFTEDITPRKKAALALRASEEFKQFVLDSVSSHIAVLDEQGIIMATNARWKDFARANARKNNTAPLSQCDIGADYLAVCRRSAAISKEAQLALDGIMAVMDRTLPSFNLEYSCHSPTQQRWFLMIVTPLGAQGRAVVISHSDITTRKVAERQLSLQSSALAAADNAIIITNAKGNIEWVNPAFSRLTGYTSAEVIGKNPRFLRSDEQTDEFYAELWRTILAGNVWHGELVNRRKDGSRYLEDMTVTPVLGEGGKLTHFIAIKQDVTERKQLNLRLQQAEKMEAIGTLAGGIAHDFNNILAAMFGYGYLLQSDCEGNAIAMENVDEILKAAMRAKDLVQQILTFSRQREQKRQIIRLNTVIKEAMKFMRASLPAGIKIEMELREEAPPVLADPSQIYQVVLNLATNAFHAMEGRQGMLTVSLNSFKANPEFRRQHPEIHADDLVELVITDTGHGMHPEVLEHIFEPFYTTKPVGKGTGLGLSVVHGIVRSHEGVIEVSSKMGAGTSFKIYFPARFEPHAAVTTDASTLPHGRGQCVLVVDDESPITGVFQKFLTRLNYRVITANSPLTALEIFSRRGDEIEFVLTDLAMPDMDGLDLAAKLHALQPQVPIVLASGLTTGLTPERLAQSGVSTVLEKPVDNAALARLMHQLLASPKPEQVH